MKLFNIGNNNEKYSKVLDDFTSGNSDNGFTAPNEYSIGIERYNINCYNKDFIKSKHYIQLRDYQKEIVKQTNKHKRGIIALPTGTGKTFCQAEIIHQDIKNNPGFRIYVLNSPRILLSYQLLKEVFQVLNIHGVESRYMMVHSSTNVSKAEMEEIRTMNILDDNGNTRPPVPYSEIQCGISIDSISLMLEHAKLQNLPVIFVSTYNSCENIQRAINKLKYPNINIVLNDEAHYLVQEQFHYSLKSDNDDRLELITDRQYFFTATLVETSSDYGRGMNNEELYGKVIYEMKPAVAILKGLIVRPRIHMVTTENVHSKEDFTNSLPFVIKDCFDKHAGQLLINPKLLIAVRGLPQIKSFITSDIAKQLMDDGVVIYGAASNDPDRESLDISFYTRNNVIIKDKNNFLKQLKKEGKDPNKRLIVLHFDTLSEGIDIDGLTGLLPLRTLKKNKFLQNFGRISRIFNNDKPILFNGGQKDIHHNSITASDIHNMNKPFAWIILPEILHGDSDETENLKYMIAELRSFNFGVEDIVSDVLPGGSNKEEENLPKLNEQIEKKKKVVQLITELFHEIEEEEKAMLFKKQCELEAKLPKKSRLDKYK